MVRVEEVANGVRANTVRETGRWRSPAQILATNAESTIKALGCIQDPKVCRAGFESVVFLGGKGLNEAEMLA